MLRTLTVTASTSNGRTCLLLTIVTLTVPTGPVHKYERVPIAWPEAPTDWQVSYELFMSSTLQRQRDENARDYNCSAVRVDRYRVVYDADCSSCANSWPTASFVSQSPPLAAAQRNHFTFYWSPVWRQAFTTSVSWLPSTSTMAELNCQSATAVY